MIKKITKEFYNNQICMFADKLSIINDNKEYFPAKAIFYIQKNINIISNLAFEIFSVRDEIVKKYSELTPNNEYRVPIEKQDLANRELQELFYLKQEIEIYQIPFSWIEDINFTSEQMNALIFMINENE